ncbi:AraC family transcriptional regulator [Rhodopseudomonas palustris]|uniref:AraC family transcriptional regulator n=1 Tax=Rhodopseudomonas palustris TaxID=1076 RepID=UPI0006419D51|nr:AraC family transcriptional regulator [Rhodopseudomonas palustris]
MTVELLNEPLSRYPAFDTTDPEELRQALQAVYGARLVDAPPAADFQVRSNFVQLEDVALGFGVGIGAITVEFPEGECARLQIALAGQFVTRSGGSTTAINARQSGIISPGRSARTEYGQTYKFSLLRVQSSALERKLGSLLGCKPKAALEFEPAANNEAPQVVNLRRLLCFLANQLNCSPLPHVVLAELQEAITLLFLNAFRHNYSRQLERESHGIAPKHVRQVEEYIEANWMRPITIEKLTALTGISSRGIFKAFQRSRGYSPMAFAKRVRLQHAHNLLADGAAPTTVTAAALSCGFSNLGHFARDYRDMFGEKPSETLQRSRP